MGAILGALIFLCAIAYAFVSSALFSKESVEMVEVKNSVKSFGFLGFYIFVLGMFLIVFSPAKKDKEVFLSYHKFMVAGFSVASLSIMFMPPFLNIWGIGRLIFFCRFLVYVNRRFEAK